MGVGHIFATRGGVADLASVVVTADRIDRCTKLASVSHCCFLIPTQWMGGSRHLTPLEVSSNECSSQYFEHCSDDRRDAPCSPAERVPQVAHDASNWSEQKLEGWSHRLRFSHNTAALRKTGTEHPVTDDLSASCVSLGIQRPCGDRDRTKTAEHRSYATEQFFLVQKKTEDTSQVVSQDKEVSFQAVAFNSRSPGCSSAARASPRARCAHRFSMLPSQFASILGRLRSRVELQHHF